MSRHSFDPEIAAQVGLNAAVIYQNLFFWIEKNEANGQNFRDGRYWTYNSVAAFAKLFPYLTEKQIRTALEKLIDSGLILKGNYCDDRFLRTAWYALNTQVCPSGQIELPDEAATFDHKGKSYDLTGKSLENRYNPDITSDSKPPPRQPAAVAAEESDLRPIWDAYPEDRRRNHEACRYALIAALAKASVDELTAAAKSYAEETAEYTRSKVMFLDNWLRTGKWQRCVEGVRQQITASDAGAGAGDETLIAYAALWIPKRSELCKHVQRRHAEVAIERGLITLEQARSAGVMP